MADRIHISGPIAMVVAGLLIGLEVLIIPFTREILVAGGLVIFITLFARWLCVGTVVALLLAWLFGIEPAFRC